MGFDTNESDSESVGAGTFDQSVWNPEAMAGMQAQFGNLFPQTISGMQGLTPGAVAGQQGVAGAADPYWQSQMAGGAFEGMDLQGMYGEALGGGGAEQDIYSSIMGGAGNDYVDAMKQQMQSDAFENLQQGFNVTDLRATMAGQPGSSRHGILQSNLMDQTMSGLTDAQTKLGYDTFAQDQAMKLGIAQRADQFDMSKLQNISDMMGQQQGAMAGGLGFGTDMQNLNMGQFAPYMMPWQAAGSFSNAMGSPTVLGSGSASSASDSSSKGFGAGVGGGK